MGDDLEYWMSRAIGLAQLGEGWVEPNPMVGCVLVKDGRAIGSGFHRKFGEAHAEINAIRNAAQNGHATSGATALVTLEPCSHQGKTGPCTEALIEAGVTRVVIGHQDPFKEVSGQGIAQLQAAGIQVTTGILDSQCRAINAPYLTRILEGRPWVIAKWAMTLDGKIATRTGDSQWISNERSRQWVQRLRGRVDAVVVGIGTALDDNPMLNARPDDPQDIKRIATRIVLDSRLRISLDSKLVQTARQFPVLVACGENVDATKVKDLESAACEVWQSTSVDPHKRLVELLRELGQRSLTNILVEGGPHVLGSLNDLNLIDEIHLFVGPHLFGSREAPGAIAGQGVDLVGCANEFQLIRTEVIDSDVLAIYQKIRQRKI